MLCFDGFELRANIVVVNLELEHFFITNGICDDIGVQLSAKHTGCGVCAQRVLREDRRAGKAKLVELLELILQVFLCLAKLAAMAFIENKDHLLAVNRQVSFALYQIVELLDGRDDDLVVILVQITL